MKILIATKNKGKIGSFGEIFDELNIEYCTLADLNVGVGALDIPETGKTSLENAIIKAKAYYEATKMPLLAADSALYIEKFPEDKQPGVFAKRYGGKENSDDETLEIYSKELNNVGGESDGHFLVAIAIVDKDGNMHTKEFKSHRHFVSRPCAERIEHFPLRSLIYYKEVNKYMAQMTFEESNAIEGQVILDQKEFIKEIFLCTK